MRPNPKDNASLRKFFKDNKGLTNIELAILADCSVATITLWKRRCGVIKDPYVKPAKPLPTPVEDWDSKEFFEEHYVQKEMGLLAIAALIGHPNDWDLVARRLKRHGIRRRTHEEAVSSKNPCCDEGWLQYHYSRRPVYLKWCEENGMEPDDEGGCGLTLHKCAELAGVSHQTIANWLALFQVQARGLAESGVYKPKRKLTLREIRQARDTFFEEYRAGTINMIIKGQRYSNGKRVDKDQTFAQRFGKLPRRTSKRSQS